MRKLTDILYAPVRYAERIHSEHGIIGLMALGIIVIVVFGAVYIYFDRRNSGR